MSAENRPSKKQQELLTFIRLFIQKYGYGPSYREVRQALGYRSVSTVAVHIDNLIRKGHLAKRHYSARSLEVVDDSTPATPVKKATPSQEKWLVAQITAKFAGVETNKTPSQSDIDELYVLVGALQVLGFVEAARSFKSRLLVVIKRH